MAVPVINFAELPTEGDPMMQAIIPALMAGMQLKYAPKNAQLDFLDKKANLSGKQISNDLEGAKVPYAGQLAAANLQNQQLINQFYSPEMISKIASMNSSTQGQNINNSIASSKVPYAGPMEAADLENKNLINKFYGPEAETKMATMPYQAMGSFLGGLGRFNQAGWQSSPNNQFIKMMNNPEMQSLIANNPDIAKSVASMMSNVAMNTGSSSQMPNPQMMNQAQGLASSTPGAMNIMKNMQQPGIQQNMSSNAMQTPMNSVQNIQSQQQNGQMSMFPQQGINPQNQDINQMTQGQSPVTPDQLSELMNTAGDVNLKSRNTTGVLNQQKYGAMLNSLFDEGDKLMPSVSKYSGIKGSLLEAFDQARSSMGLSSPDYENYSTFINQTAPLTANEMKRTLGGQATDKESELMGKIANPIRWKNDPDLALKQWNQLKDLYKNHIDKILYKSNFENKKDISQNTSNKYALSEDDINLVKKFAAANSIK